MGTDWFLMKSKISLLDEGIQRLKAVLNRHGIQAENALYESGFDEIKLTSLDKKIVIFPSAVLHPSRIDILFRELHIKGYLKDGAESVPLLLTPAISESSFDYCRELGLNVFDLADNILLRVCGVYIERYRRSPKGERPRTSGTVFSAKASRIVRALLVCPGRDWKQIELVDETGLSRGYVSRIVQKLTSEGIISGGGHIRLREPGLLLEEWARHYRFDRHHKKAFALSFKDYDNGLGKTSEAMSNAGIGFAFTGWSGAYLRAPYGIPERIMAYVERFPQPSDGLPLFEVEHGGNVVLYLPQDAGVFQYMTNPLDLPVVCDPQLYVDLRQMPGRAEDQATALRDKLLLFEDA